MPLQSQLHKHGSQTSPFLKTLLDPIQATSDQNSVSPPYALTSRTLFSQPIKLFRLMKFKILEASIFASSAAARLNSMNSSCDIQYASVPIQIMLPSFHAKVSRLRLNCCLF